jgi:micrococcal nuclease
MRLSRFLAFLAVVILIINVAYFYPRFTGKGVYEPETVNMVEVIDGDTFKTEESDVRLLCINTPEKNKPYYQEAKDFLLQFQGGEVQILRDKEDLDKYNRKLRFVFLGKRFINKELVEKGLATVYMCEGTPYDSDIKESEDNAREKQVGLWKKSTSNCSNCIELVELNATAEYFILKNKCSYSCEFEAKDEANHFFQITLEAKEQKKIESKEKVWNDDGDRLFLRDEQGLILYYKY